MAAYTRLAHVFALVSLSLAGRPERAHAQVAGAPPPPTPLPLAPAVDDAMLTPVPPAPHVVGSWEEAIRLVLAGSADLRIAVDEVHRAEGLSREALAGALPTLTGSANATVNLLRGEVPSMNPTTLNITAVTVPDKLTYSGSLSLVQPLLAPRAWHAIGTAHRAETNARISAEEEKRQIALSLASTVVSVVTAEHVSELNRIGLRAALERLALAARKQELGAANALDVVRAQQDVATARTTLVSGDESLRQSREALGLALGFAAPWGVPPSINLDSLAQGARAMCRPMSTLDNRSDLAALRGAEDVAARNVDDVWLQFSPTVNLVSTATAASTTLINNQHETWTIAGVLTVPLWDGGARYGSLTDTRAQHDEAVQRLGAARRAAQVQVTQAERGIEVAEQSRRVSEQARDLARETERLSRIAFQAGSGTSLNLIESGRRLREAETQLALAEFNVVQARMAALLAMAHCAF